MHYVAQFALVRAFSTKVSTALVLSRVVLKNISWFTGEKDLKYYFGRFGKVLHVKLLYDWGTGLHRGFAFVTFENIDDAVKAVQQRYHYINGRQMATHLVRKFSSALKTFRRARRNGPELLVKRISWVTGASELTDYFSQFGKVSNITLPFDLRTGLHKGFAFISFENNDFYENIKKFEGRLIIDDEEVICSLATEEKSVLSHGASAMQLNRRIYKNGYKMDISKTDSDSEVVEFIKNEEECKEKKMKFNTPKLIFRSSIDFQVHKKGAKEANLLHKLRKVSDPEEESERGSGFSDIGSSKKNSRVTTTTRRD